MLKTSFHFHFARYLVVINTLNFHEIHTCMQSNVSRLPFIGSFVILHLLGFHIYTNEFLKLT